ncbi:MAG: hypothetical protein AB7H88_10905 [Vicinamibacterales bacterium]
MARYPRRFLSRLSVIACPICLDVADQGLTAGLRAGAFVLVLVALVVIVAVARFALALRRRELDGDGTLDRRTA